MYTNVKYAPVSKIIHAITLPGKDQKILDYQLTSFVLEK